MHGTWRHNSPKQIPLNLPFFRFLRPLRSARFRRVRLRKEPPAVRLGVLRPPDDVVSLRRAAGHRGLLCAPPARRPAPFASWQIRDFVKPFFQHQPGVQAPVAGAVRALPRQGCRGRATGVRQALAKHRFARSRTPAICDGGPAPHSGCLRRVPHCPGHRIPHGCPPPTHLKGRTLFRPAPPVHPAPNRGFAASAPSPDNRRLSPPQECPCPSSE
ncbi:hypothetical protein SAMN06296416_102321 [Pseudoxanthomonas wuyuanensis]|uniref:Uncharacterized protein n=1 Tax=Pseudoxanthomonas wuyuanensis TaxID=1073196 RepID=A0A286D3M4_9GAMM|nr:hypothetical protein SAMN06296416_102321 [Pseudoxanthomonas wuyuanensis]